MKRKGMREVSGGGSEASSYKAVKLESNLNHQQESKPTARGSHDHQSSIRLYQRKKEGDCCLHLLEA